MTPDSLLPFEEGADLSACEIEPFVDEDECEGCGLPEVDCDCPEDGDDD